jgi:ArpU family phage transcriptional regulator
MSSTTVVVNAYKFFNKYFDRILSIGGRLPMDLIPENLSNIKPSNDERFTPDIIQAETIAYCVALAINDCKNEPRKPYKTILIDVYLKELSNIDTMQEVGYEHSRYNVLKRQAMNEFAGRFNVYAIKAGVNSIIELSLA